MRLVELVCWLKPPQMGPYHLALFVDLLEQLWRGKNIKPFTGVLPVMMSFDWMYRGRPANIGRGAILWSRLAPIIIDRGFIGEKIELWCGGAKIATTPLIVKPKAVFKFWRE
jgi:hypothetical protein